MIAAGEAGGILDTILKRLATYIEKAAKLTSEVKAAMMYPVFVIIFAGIIVAAIMVFVIPTFAKLFNDLGATLPLPTRIVMAMSSGLVSYGVFILAGMAAAAYGIRRYYATDAG